MKKRWIFLALIFSMIIATMWESASGIKTFFHKILDPTLIPLLSWNATYGMILITLILATFMTFVQKYGTDQETIREIKKQQKKIQAEMKKYKDNPEKIMDLNKQQFEFMGTMMKASMSSIVYTAVPFVLLFRWFGDYFSTIPEFRFFGFMTWFWFYFIFSIIFSSFLRKALKVA